MKILPSRPLTELTAHEWGALLKVVPVILFVRLGLSTMSFKALVERLRQWSRQLSANGSYSDEEVRRICWAVGAVGSRVLGSRPCLTQALAVQFLLWRRGIETELRIGVDKDESGKLLAHAWVVLDDEVIIGGRLSEMKYKVLPGLSDKVLR